LPYSRSLAPNARLELSPGVTLNVAGFEHLMPSASACLLGMEAAHFTASVATLIRPVLERFDGPDATLVGLVAHEDRRVPVEDRDREEVFGLFRWFRLAAGL